MKIVILGSSGMLGYQLTKFLSSKDDLTVYPMLRNTTVISRLKNIDSKNIIKIVDIKNIEALSYDLELSKPEFVINCIGIVKQSNLATNRYESIYINSLLPHKLSSICSNISATLIHISTDCVFNGKKGMYNENDESDALDIYGKTKYLGEVGYSPHITIRTSIIGHELYEYPHGLLDWFLNQSDECSGYTEAWFSGLTTLELSNVIYFFIKNKDVLSGLWQVASERINKFNLLSIIKNVYKKEIIINKNNNIKIDRSLNGSRFEKETGYKIPNWITMIEQMHDDYKLGF